MLVISALPASAFHGYSWAADTSQAGIYTGVSTTRLDRTVFDQASDGCSTYFTGSPVYQTEWIYITSDAQNWLELGTGHQCGDTLRYWYWGYGYGGAWFPIGEQSGISNEVSHTFRIIKFGTVFAFQVDGNLKGTQTSSTGQRDASGLESYSSPAVIGTYTHNTLQRWTTTSGGWVNWAGYDDHGVSGAGMCGGWNSQTSWRAAENQTC